MQITDTCKKKNVKKESTLFIIHLDTVLTGLRCV